MFFLQPNHRRLLSSFNPVFVVGFVFFCILVRTTFSPFFADSLQRWDIMMPVAVYLGQRRPMWEGLILTLFSSHLYSLASTAPIGVFATQYLILFMLSRVVSYVLYANAWYTILSLISINAVLSRLLLPFIARFFGHSWTVLGWGNLNAKGIFVNAALGYLSFWVLGQLDKLTFKAPRLSIQLSEQSL